MDQAKHRVVTRGRIRARIRRKINGTTARPRLAVFKSLKHFYVQVIDDTTGTTLASASTAEKDFKGKFSSSNIEAAKAVGAAIAGRMKEKGVTNVVFDRGGYMYHGSIKALAEAARENGLQF